MSALREAYGVRTPLPRHAGHHHNMGHAHKAYLFWGLAFGTMVLYSTALLARGRLLPKRRFRYTVPSWALILVWAVICGYPIIVDQRSDLKWIARRFGRISLAVAVFSQYLALKPALLPRTYVLPLTFVHKWTGRTAVILGVVHGAVYFEAYRRMSLLMLLLNRDNLLGIAALAAYCLIGLTSLVFIRRRFYFIFYLFHYPLSWLSTICLFWHAHPDAHMMVEVSLVLYGIQIAWRIMFSKVVTATVDHVTPTLDLVTLDRRSLPSNYPIGAHLRIGPRLWNPKAWILASHPYTVASLASDKTVKLIIRKTRFQFQAASYAAWGPFPAPFDLFSFEKVVVIGGGAGVALIPPLERAARGTATRVKSIWITRSADELAILDAAGVQVCDVYLTRDHDHSGYDDTVPHEVDEEAAYGRDGFELQDLEYTSTSEDTHVLTDEEAEGKPQTTKDEVTRRLLSSSTSSGTSADSNSPYIEDRNIRTFKGRPNLTTAIDTFLDDKDTAENTCIVACGPGALVHDVRAWAESHRLSFFAEDFSM